MLTEKIDANSKDLSGGMKCKFLFVIVFIGSLFVVFFDELMFGMDFYL